MELRKHPDFRKVITAVYFAAFAVYLVVGLQPVDARHYDVSAVLDIPSISLHSDVTSLSLEDHHLNTPDTIVGSYSRARNKTFLIGHSTTVFTNLHNIKKYDSIFYKGKEYTVSDITTVEKTAVDMTGILASADEDTIVIMTCAGEIINHTDATHRLIVTAVSSRHD